jgi:hypothetical protein
LGRTIGSASIPRSRTPQHRSAGIHDLSGATGTAACWG